MIKQRSLLRWYPLASNYKELANNYDLTSNPNFNFSGVGINRPTALTYLNTTASNFATYSNSVWLTDKPFTIVGWLWFSSCFLYQVLFSEANTEYTRYSNSGVYGMTADGASGWIFWQFTNSNGDWVNFWNNGAGGTNLGTLRNQWVHFAVSNSAPNWASTTTNTVKLYLNGKLEPTYVSTSYFSGSLPTKTTEKIGNTHYSSGHQSRWQNIRIYNRVLTHEEIKRDMLDFHPLGG